MARLEMGLRAKVQLAFALVLLPVLGLLWTGFRASVTREQESVLHNQELTAHAVAVQVDEAFDALIGFGWAVAQTPVVRSGDDKQLATYLRQLHALLPRAPTIAVLDEKGHLRGWAGPHPPTEPAANDKDYLVFRLVMAVNLPQVSGVLPARQLGAVGIAATVPLRDADDQPAGVIVVGALATDLAERYEHARLLPGQSIMLADRNGHLAFHTGQRNLSFEAGEALADAEPLRTALAGVPKTQAHFFSFADHAREEHLAAFVPTPKYHWAVGVTVPRAIALAPIEGLFRQELFAFLAILLVSAVLAAGLTRYLISPVRRLELAAAALGEGHLESRVAVSSGDELGRLGATFNTMATQLTGLYQEQRRLVQLREDFMQAAAHELKTPIATIKSSLYLIETAPAPDPGSLRMIEIISRQADRMTLLVEDLLTVTLLAGDPRAAPERGPAPELRRRPTNLGQIVADAIRTAPALADHQAIHLTPEPGADSIVVDADPALIRMVVVRLLENAILASPQGRPVEVEIIREGSEAKVAIADRGPGVAVERQADVFEPFYEAVPSGRPGYAGVVSLRLHVCKRILDVHGGRIWFTSTLGQGSRFCFALPLAPI